MPERRRRRNASRAGLSAGTRTQPESPRVFIDGIRFALKRM
jgi:hypothetical protein